MKKYKTWEVIKMLEENPKLKFEAAEELGEEKTISIKNNRICWGGKDRFPLYVLIGKKATEWTLVQEPVSFMEAVKAYGKGKTINCECQNDVFHYIPKYAEEDQANWNDLLANGEFQITSYEILNGKWYIEED